MGTTRRYCASAAFWISSPVKSYANTPASFASVPCNPNTVVLHRHMNLEVLRNCYLFSCSNARFVLCNPNPVVLHRHMYLEVLRNCYLFNGCKARFLDELLSMARMELFMPNVS